MKVQLQYCTLFNTAYLARGLAMYRSLKRNCDDFHLYVFAFDDETLAFFRKQSFPNLTVISLAEFEDTALLGIKSSRTAGEYCWTCTSSTILYCIEKFDLDHCTYIDADMIFYADPDQLHQEMGESSVMITEHRYIPAYDQSATSGIYCVQYVSFKNDTRGMKTLRWWRDACIEWCYNRLEDGKFGDQKYLDDWTTRFEGVHVMINEGGGVAPWNVQRYNFVKQGHRLLISKKGSAERTELVFFHYHGLKFHVGDTVEFTGAGYALPGACVAFLYMPYSKELFETADEIRRIFPSIQDPNGVSAVNFPSRSAYRLKILKANIANLLRLVLGRRPSFRASYDHVYRRSEL